MLLAFSLTPARPSLADTQRAQAEAALVEQPAQLPLDARPQTEEEWAALIRRAWGSCSCTCGVQPTGLRCAA